MSKNLAVGVSNINVALFHIIAEDQTSASTSEILSLEIISTCQAVAVVP
jgi:hypothetical protein